MFYRHFDVCYSGDLVHNIDGERRVWTDYTSINAGRYHVAIDFPREIQCFGVQERLGVTKLYNELASCDSIAECPLKSNWLHSFAGNLSSDLVAFFSGDSATREEMGDSIVEEIIRHLGGIWLWTRYVSSPITIDDHVFPA